MDPLFGSLYVDVPQTGVAVRRMQSDKKFIARDMVPMLKVLKPSGKYPVIVDGDLNRDEMEARGPNAPAQKGGWRRILQDFSTDARSLGYDLNDAEAAGADVETNPDIWIPQVLGYKASLNLEVRLKTKFFADGVWERNINGAGADANLDTDTPDRLFVDNANADPVEQFTDEIRRLMIRTGCGPMDICLAIGNLAWHKIRNHAKVKSQIVGVAGGPIGTALVGMAKQATQQQFAELLGIRKVLVGMAMRNTGVMTSDATLKPTNAAIIPEEESLLYVNPYDGDAGMDPNSLQPAAFCRPVWSGVAGANNEGVQIRKFRDEKAGPSGSWSHVIDVYYGLEVVTKSAAVRWKNMLT